ncbi:EAL domain-containing protein [Actinotalea ferrariae]|uniref:EAL domain-containing protein n=1 Tax=Actinotalea ferrariae TaxID=1386098 RepID=UPI001C8BB6B0|nr:EAL domain-containing protein [Actinotalea ferrariae]MBX9246321.1 EAL domain-containing protein [Actinotalea ferrariae]
MVHIGVLSPVTGGFYFGEVLAGVVRVVAAAGGRVTLVQTLDAGHSGDEFVPAPDLSAPVGWDHLDGFVTVAQATGAGFLQRIRATGRPVVITSNDLAVDAATVVADNVSGVRHAVAHLVEHGHRSIAFVGNLAQTDMLERFHAYRAAVVEHGLPHDDDLHVPTADHVETGGRGAADAVAAARAGALAVTAVVASTDRIALGLMDGLRERGLRVPEDVAVVGFDDVEAGWHASPPLATVDQQITELGAEAARLLLAELRGEPVEHRRHVVPSSFRPRGSCGCGADTGASSGHGARDGAAVADAVLAFLATAAGGGDVDLDALDALITSEVHARYPTAPSPETFEAFTDAAVGRLVAWDPPGAGGGDAPAVRGLVQRAVVRLGVVLARLQAVAGLERSARLAHSLVEQYDVGKGLLGDVGADPSDLRWLGQVSVRLGYLALWDGPPSAGRLRTAGLYDPHRLLDGPLPAALPVEQLPPRAVMEQARALEDEVTFVVPVRGTSGDHGFLCVIGAVDTSAGTGRATYNHWAALLGVALQQEALLEDVRRNEQRYSLAAAATRDGLWDWDVDGGQCFYSERCQELLGTDQERASDLRALAERTGDSRALLPLLGAVHHDDLAAVRSELRRAVAQGQPFEIEHRVVLPDGSHRWLLCRAVPEGEPGTPARRVVGSLSDIHPRKELEEQLRQAAMYDTVTGLPNRRLFLDRLRWSVEQSQRRGGARFAVVFLDLDGFKLVNDSLGHLAGDQLLAIIGQRLRDDLRSVDTAARFGGDEFAVLLYDLKQEAVLSVVERIQERIAAPVVVAGHEVAVTASVGVATSDTGYSDAEDVLRDADIAMYHAKESERGTASLFDPEMHSRATGRLRAQSELRTALVEQQFVVHYQPVVALDGSALTQFEALVRWEHPTRGLMLPGEFLPVMADSGTIVTLGQWILDAVAAQIAAWRRAYAGPVSVSVNLSHREFWSDQLLATVTHALVRHRVPPSCLVLEITESVIMSDPEAARQIMDDLHAAGVRLHIDDFGTGHSSLNALRAFPVDALKIDQSFVGALETDRQTSELVRIIVAMGSTLGLEVVAEGVETPGQEDHLRSMGCANVQGWLYARALPGDEAGAMLGTTVRPAVAAAAR